MIDICVSKIERFITVASSQGEKEEMTNRKYYGLCFCTEGQITYTHNGKNYVSNKDCAVILPKGQSYMITREKSGTFPLVDFSCAENFTDEFIVIPIKNTEWFLRQYEKMRVLSLVEGNEFSVLGIFYGILHELFGRNEKNILTPAIRCLETDFSDPTLTNLKLAQKCHISEVYFRKLFLREFGISPRQFLLDLRIANAKQLLSEGRLKSSAIAEKCGFSDSFHFCRTFKSKTGFTPTEYMKLNRNSKI